MSKNWWSKMDPAQRRKVALSGLGVLFITVPAIFTTWWYIFSSTPPYQWFRENGLPAMNFPLLWIAVPIVIGLVILGAVLRSIRKENISTPGSGYAHAGESDAATRSHEYYSYPKVLARLRRPRRLERRETQPVDANSTAIQPRRESGPRVVPPNQQAAESVVGPRVVPPKTTKQSIMRLDVAALTDFKNHKLKGEQMLDAIKTGDAENGGKHTEIDEWWLEAQVKANQDAFSPILTLSELDRFREPWPDDGDKLQAVIRAIDNGQITASDNDVKFYQRHWERVERVRQLIGIIEKKP